MVTKTTETIEDTFEECILDAADIRQGNLLIPARVAAEKPDTGVKILKKSAYYVIKDCASITCQYVTFLAYASLKDPLKQLKGLFTKECIIDFVGRSKEEHHTNQLLTLVFADISRVSPPKVTVNIDSGPEFDFNNEDGPYGDYNYDGYLEKDDYTEADPQVIIDKIDMTNDSAVVKKLVDVFM
tara:strand:+ start:1373 stop:1924 length:552 start_codon:yes stop_codon:yes gene_type:complete